jgi:hypothetical protein
MSLVGGPSASGESWQMLRTGRPPFRNMNSSWTNKPRNFSIACLLASLLLDRRADEVSLKSSAAIRGRSAIFASKYPLRLQKIKTTTLFISIDAHKLSDESLCSGW